MKFYVEQILDENSKGTLDKLKTKRLNANETNYNIPIQIKQGGRGNVHREVQQLHKFT